MLNIGLKNSNIALGDINVIIFKFNNYYNIRELY